MKFGLIAFVRCEFVQKFAHITRYRYVLVTFVIGYMLDKPLVKYVVTHKRSVYFQQVG